MLSLLLFGLIAGASAAPQFYGHHGHRQHGPPPFFPDDGPSNNYFDNDMFDTGRFWADISKELREIDDMLADFSRRFPTSVSAEGIEGNEYKINIPLSGFDEKDIVVKAREGLLMVQANHKYSSGSERNYLDVRNLPTTVNVTGNWVFEDEILKIVFPLKNGVEISTTTTTEASEVAETFRPAVESREEMDNHSDDTVVDADVGVNRGDQDSVDRDREVMTNEIPDRQSSVEATTYAVDLKDEVEFVPVRY